jgi:hypothetical protein
LQTKEEEEPAKEAFNGTAFAQFFFGPGWRQTRAVLLSLGIPGNHRNGSQRGVDRFSVNLPVPAQYYPAALFVLLVVVW